MKEREEPRLQEQEREVKICEFCQDPRQEVYYKGLCKTCAAGQYAD